MQRFIVLTLFQVFALAAFAQSSAKRYVLLEHFTNSNCSICASRNPTFYNTINQYSADVHHIAFHPSVPYPSCVFYQANPTENNSRSSYYGINGTPRVALNGNLIQAGNPLLPVATLQAQLNQTSPLLLQVMESGTGAQRTAVVTAKSLGTIPAGNYKLYVAAVEKTVNQTTGNGESVHRDVFRKMLPDANGITFTPPAQGETATFTLDYTISPNWNAAEMYVVAYVQNTSSKEILNSGTKFDPVVTATDEPTRTHSVRLYPNPTREFGLVQLDNDEARQVAVYDLSGRLVEASFEQAGNTLTVNTAALSPGVYLLKIRGDKAVYTAKFIRE